MYSVMEIADRLRQARIESGCRSALEAAQTHGWTASTYAAHENGTRIPKPKDIAKYAAAFKSDPCFITYGTNPQQTRIAGVSESALRQVVKFVMQHEGAKDADEDVIADLIIDLCHYVTRSGEGGLSNIVDFEMRRRAAQAG
ncbi:helix-turn-helix transcriptional regulator [Thalassobius aquimarinus]|uniref:Helix-turn-helix transcriptional regulator n=2 Tax=Thalassovita aquimarina TaxID=2785917 RepID=A0ABS5HSK2_9RHOB|nr:helix-turn-helix transcriptional regulator [Thalassovita aquimarina]